MLDSSMKAFSRSVIENLTEPSNFYRSSTDIYHTDRYVNFDAKLQPPIYNTDLDNYSDLSEDASSTLSFDSSEWKKYYIPRNQNRYVHPEIRTLEEARMQSGDSMSKGSLSPFELTNVPNTPRLSDAEMTELFLLEEQEELQYLAELVHQDIVAADILAADYFTKCYSGTPEKTYWDMEPPLSERSVFLDKSSLSSNKFSNEDFLNGEQLNHEDEPSKQFFSEKDVPVSSKSILNSKVCKQGKTMEKHPKLHQKGRRLRTQQAPKEVKEVEQLPASIVPKNHKQKKDRTKAKAAPFPCESKSNSNADQKIFLGGLPIGMTERTLREQMSALGYKVLKRPKILRGFAPEVWMRSVEQAQELVARKTITIGGVEVEVRPYNSLTKLSVLKKIPNVVKRSIFIGGLSFGTTANDLKDALGKLGMKVLNYPVIKDGFSRQVILETIAQAKTLIKMKKILLNGKLVEIKPFVNQHRKNRRD